MAQAIEKAKKTWVQVLEENKDKFAMALPRVGLTPERVMRTALTAMQQSRGGKLLQCEPKSVVASLIQACEVGLSVSNTLGHAYLVPFRNSEKGVMECTLIIGYRGYLELMKRSNQVSDVKATIIYDKEPFEMGAGDHPYLKHTPLPPGQRGKSIVGAYATVLYRDGNSTFEFMWYEDILKLKSRSKAKDSGPWQTDEEEMIKKCPIRRIAKRMPMSTDLQKAAVIDEYNESGLRATDMLIPDEPEKPIEETVKPKEPEKKQEKEPEPEQPEPNAKQPPEQKPDLGSLPAATAKQLTLINTLFANLDSRYTPEQKHAIIGVDILGKQEAIETMKALTKDEASKCIAWLQEKEREMA